MNSDKITINIDLAGYAERIERLAKESAGMFLDGIGRGDVVPNMPNIPPPPVKAEPPKPKVKDETMRRLRIVCKHQATCQIPAEALAVVYAADASDNLMLSDLDEILAALEQRQ